MDAAQALADLTEISSQVIHVAIVGADAGILATTIPDPGRARRFVDGVEKLLEEADRLRQSRGLPWLSQLEAATLDGSVFLVRSGERMVAATTRPDPTVGLVFYDLKHCLRSIEEPVREPAVAEGEAAKPARQPRKKADASA